MDFSIYDQALWLYSRFNLAFSTVTGHLDLADRFRPIMIFLSPLYWFTRNERVLLIFQAIILSATVFPIWLIGRKYLPRILAVSIAFIYVDFIGIQAINVYDFHEMSVLPFLLGWCFYFLEKGYWKSFFIALLLSLSVREHVGLILTFLGAYIWLAKKNARLALITSVVSFVWSFMAIKIIMPHLGQHGYSSFLDTGDSLEGAIGNYIFNPIFTVKSFFFPLDKVNTLFWTFFSFGMMPIFAFSLLPLIGFQFASRFLDSMHPIRWTLYYHYSAELAVFMAIAAIISLRKFLGRYGYSSKIITVSLLVILVPHFMTNIILHAPLKNLLKVQFWQKQSWMADDEKLLSLIPASVSVASQNNLLPHISHRSKVYLLPDVSNADYIVFDFHQSQNQWNFYTSNLATSRQQMTSLVLDEQYKILVSSGDAYLLEKRVKN